MGKKITSFDELYFAAVDPNGMISSFISGHLMVEFMLLRLIEISSLSKLRSAEKLTHYKLIKYANKLELISDLQTNVLIEVNKFAHNIAYRPTVEELRSLFILAKENFNDLTDGIIQGIGELEGKSSVDDCEPYIFSDLFIQITYDLHEMYQELGGDIIEFKSVDN